MRIEKVAILNEVTERVKASDYCFILNYGGVSVDKLAALRTALKAHDSRLLIVKNTYLAKVAKEKGWSDGRGHGRREGRHGLRRRVRRACNREGRGLRRKDRRCRDG